MKLLNGGVDEEMDMHDLKDKVTDEIVDIINNHVEDNLARVIASRIPQYNIDWCSEDAYSFASISCDRYKEDLARAETDVLFENAPEELNEELNNTDGWGDTIPEMLEQFFEALEEFMYEVRNARRNSYAKFGDDVEAIVDKLHAIAEDADDLAYDIDAEEDRLNESLKINKNKKSLIKRV